MQTIILTLLQLSLMASVMAALVLGIRLCIKKAPKIYAYILWIFVFIRAVLPVSYSSALSVWNMPLRFLQPKAPAKAAADMILPPQTSGVSAGMAQAALTPLSQAAKTGFPVSAARPVSPWAVTAAIWLLGVAAMLAYSLFAMRRLKKTVAFSTLSEADQTVKQCRVYESDQIRTAFILGFFRPAIYLPKGLSRPQKRMLLEHEAVHLLRHDHQIKMAAWVILSLHWFNPVLWAGFCFLNKDMELSCDEQALKNLGPQARADYGLLLLDLAVSKRIPSGIPLAFSERDVKSRIKNILSRRPVTFGSVAAATFLVIFTLYGCMGSPGTNGGPKETVSETTTPEQPMPEEKEPEHTASEELAADDGKPADLSFADKFISLILNNDAEGIYAALSSALQEKADRHVSDGFGLWLSDNGKQHIRINPFGRFASLSTDRTATGFSYKLKRDLSASSEDVKYASADTWEGEFSLEETGDGNGFQVSEWTEIVYNEITSFEEYAWLDNEYDYPSRFQLNAAWVSEHPNEAVYREPESLLLEEMRLTQGEIAGKEIDADGKKLSITYRWSDGGVTFQMEKVGENGIWAVTEQFFL